MVLVLRKTFFFFSTGLDGTSVFFAAILSTGTIFLRLSASKRFWILYGSNESTTCSGSAHSSNNSNVALPQSCSRWNICQYNEKKNNSFLAAGFNHKAKLLFNFCNCILNSVRVLGDLGDWFHRARQNQRSVYDFDTGEIETGNDCSTHSLIQLTDSKYLQRRSLWK